MRKILFFGSLLFILVSLVRFFFAQVPTSKYRGVQAQAITNNTEYPFATQTPQPTFTIVPSATIDYQQTAIVAQSTADEARRINSMATAEYVRLLNEQLAMTQVVEQHNFTIMSWTQQAAATSIPLTATQQAIINTQIPQQQQIIAAQMTATKEGPAQLVAMRDAENRVQYGKLTYIANMVAALAIFVFAIGVVVFVFRFPMVKREPTEEKESPLETVVWVKNTKDNGTQSLRVVVPCSPEQLTELAENITQGEKTLAINQWEGKDTLFTRDVILKVRAWLRDNDFVIPTDDGQLAPTGELFDFLCGWLETKKLPSGYDFPLHSPDAGESPAHGENDHDSIITMRNHTHDNGGGGAYPHLAVDNSK